MIIVLKSNPSQTQLGSLTAWLHDNGIQIRQGKPVMIKRGLSSTYRRRKRSMIVDVSELRPASGLSAL